MCGIAGLIAKNNNNYDFTSFRNSTKLISHRGPDNFGEYYNNNLAFFHYRLSILDLDARSNQPFFSDDLNKVIVYNGEIYNFKEIAAACKMKLKTTSDTEVLLKSYEIKNEKAIEEWNGIFAFAIFDKSKNNLILGRDRCGVKPLYLYENESFIAFASEAKVILNWLNSFSLNLQGISEYLWYGNTLSNQTMIDNLIKFSPGTLMEINLDTYTKREKAFWSISKNIKKEEPDSFGNATKKTRDLLYNAVSRQLVSDAPLGIFLSGGIDSSSITAFASGSSAKKISTFSVEYDFNFEGKNELSNAALIAKKFNTNHHELMVKSGNIIEDFETLVFQYDEPFADDANLPLFLLAKSCGNEIKVVLQGDGGDELFAGYRRYKLLNNLLLWKYNSILLSKILPNKFLRNRASRMAITLNEKSNALRMALLMTQNTSAFKPENIFTPAFQQKLFKQNPFKAYELKNLEFGEENLTQRMLYTDFEILLPHTYLEKVDKATMLSSIEARVPFLDNCLTEYVLSLPASYKIKFGINKYILKKSLEEVLPKEILTAPKRGFDNPTIKWLGSVFYEYAKSKFINASKFSNIFDVNYLLRLLEEHKKQVRYHHIILWKALILIKWMELYKDKIEIESSKLLYSGEIKTEELPPRIKKKICLILPSLVIGGMERVMAMLGSYFSEIKHEEVHLVLLGKTEHFYKVSENVIIHEPQFKVTKKGFFHLIKTILYFRKIVKKLDADTILSFGEIWNNFVLFSTLGLVKSNGKKNKIFISDRARPDKNLGILHNFLKNFLYQRAEGLIVQTQKAKEINEARGVSKNIKVIPNPVRRIENNSRFKENIILSVGRLIKTKNHDKLIKLFLNLNLPDWKLIIVGNGPEKKHLENLINKTSSHNKVLLAGDQKNVEEFYNKSKIFAFTSESEGFPNVVGEALSAGLAVVSFNCIAGPSDLIEHNENGILVPVNDYSLFGKELRNLALDDKKIEKFSKAGKESIKRFSVTSISEQFYETII